MSIATPVSIPASSGGAKRFGFHAIFRAPLLAVSESIEVATRYRILARLTNQELTALGLTRKDIARVALNGWPC